MNDSEKLPPGWMYIYPPTPAPGHMVAASLPSSQTKWLGTHEEVAAAAWTIHGQPWPGADDPVKKMFGYHVVYAFFSKHGRGDGTFEVSLMGYTQWPVSSEHLVTMRALAGEKAGNDLPGGKVSEICIINIIPLSNTPGLSA